MEQFFLIIKFKFSLFFLFAPTPEKNDVSKFVFLTLEMFLIKKRNTKLGLCSGVFFSFSHRWHSVNSIVFLKNWIWFKLYARYCFVSTEKRCMQKHCIYWKEKITQFSRRRQKQDEIANVKADRVAVARADTHIGLSRKQSHCAKINLYLPNRANRSFLLCGNV